MDKKIVIVSRFPHSIDNPRGGVETATVGLARGLYNIGLKDLHVITLEREITSTQIQQFEGITVHRLKRSGWPMILDVFIGPTVKTLNQYLKDLDPDVIHFQETWGFGSYNYPWPSLFTVHGFDSLNLPAEKPKCWRIRSLAWKLAEKIGLRNQKTIISIAPYVRAEIEKVSNAKIVDIWNSIDPRYFNLKRENSAERILFLGWLNQRKNPLILIEAMALLTEQYPNVTLRICGEASDPEYFCLLKRTVKALQLNNHVTFTGRLSQTEVIQEIALTTLFILPSFQENAPMVIAESMAAGVPVIASNLCGIPDMIENEISGFLIEPTDANQIANTIKRVLGDQELTKNISSSAKTQALARYHPESVAKATFELYQELIEA